MIPKKIRLPLLVVAALAMIAVPLQMVIAAQSTIDLGREFHFRCAPRDPNDPFRGKYVRLGFEQQNVSYRFNGDSLSEGKAYAIIKPDFEGYADVDRIVSVQPEDYVNYLEVEIENVRYHNNQVTYRLDFPFDKYFMEENKAPLAEQYYFQHMNNQEKVTYAVVYIKEGKGVLDDVILDGVSINDLDYSVAKVVP